MKIINEKTYKILEAEKNKKIFSIFDNKIIGFKVYAPINADISQYVEVDDIPVAIEKPIELPIVQVDAALLAEQQSFILYSKEKLNEFLKNHPLLYQGKKYSVTSTSQSYLDTLISAAEDAADMGIPFSPRTNCAIISFQDTLTINFASCIKETDVERYFFSKLVEDGVHVTIESNRE